MSVTREEWYGGAYQVTLSGDLTVNFHHARLWDITPDTSGRTISLPDARKMRTGGTWAIVNRGADSIAVDDAAGGELVAALAQDRGLLIGLVDNSTQAGVWAIKEKAVGVVSNPALGVLGYVFGGSYAATNDDEKDVREWNPQLSTWTSKTASTYRHKRASSCVVGASGYITAGESPATTSNHEQYDPDTWTTETAYPINTMRGSGCSLNDGTATLGYVFDGYTSDATRSYDTVGNSWNSETVQPEEYAHSSSAAVSEKGYTVSIAATYEYAPVADAFVDKTEIIHGRMFFSLVGHDGSGYVFGGATSDSTSRATCWDEANTYTAATDAWSFGTDYPLGRVCESAAVALSSYIYIAGGDNFTTSTPGGVLEDGVQRYDPATDSYATQTDLPEAREEIHNQGQPIQA